MHVVVLAKDIVSTAIQAIPQAALAWTGICFALQILLNPTDESKANREGIVYVTSRMDWYWNLSKLLFKENITEVNGQSLSGLQCQLRVRIIDLYKTLLSYQMKSVCSFYRNRGVAILRDIVKLDDWQGSLRPIKDAEDAFRKDSDVYNTVESRIRSEQLVNEQMKCLGDIYSAIQQQDLRQKEREDNREDKQCLQDLRLTNPDDDMTTIENTRGTLLKDSYVWILSNRDFTDWRDGDETRLLWIRGDPGKGKTMLLIGIMKEFQNSIRSSELLSYFFCQGTNAKLNNATAVLRGLIYQLVVQQRSLISCLREQYDITGKQLFEDSNAFVALSKIFRKMLENTQHTKVYLVVDALDECESELLQLLDIIRNSSSAHVKWLVSSRNEPKIEERFITKHSKLEVSLELNAVSVSGAVEAYIRHKVSVLVQMKRYNDELREKIEAELHNAPRERNHDTKSMNDEVTNAMRSERNVVQLP